MTKEQAKKILNADAKELIVGENGWRSASSSIDGWTIGRVCPLCYALVYTSMGHNGIKNHAQYHLDNDRFEEE